ncbi:MAG: UDP-N-acetylmuramoyl-L-alanyl-D-glutamate--2,6-diaminopimelate ligase [Elusimicrobiota bacterium]|jgi:UDP-N-acetylmuramyl-tripeptide synthetase|nr:UDP-N-acetylmuramoyl-L-alanyl-D-glutamate--2,6-diaminopimelate ligase [Elusimicrobiota bacterium]
MNLKKLLREFGIYTDIQEKVTGISVDSRKVKPGYIFVTYKGYHFDGYNFIDDAIKNGAICIITDRGFRKKVSEITKYEKIIVDNIYEFSTKLAIFYFNYPARHLNLIGVTGTNGKTTTTYILESIYKKAGQKTGIIGTIQNKIGDEIFQTQNTTPFPIDLQCTLNEMVKKKVDSVFMEVSSHAISLERIKGCEYKGAIFTNLTEDHLDFHINMKNYFLAKKKLFDSLQDDTVAVINADDKYYKKMINDIKPKIEIIKYSVKKKIDIELYAQNIKFDKKNLIMTFDIVFENKEVLKVQSFLLGKHNISNILGAVGLAYFQKIPLGIIKEGIEAIKNVSGRLEFIREGQDFACVVDYAHTDDALNRILKTCKSLKMNRIITVFGCGGNRDRKKRPLMAKKAAQYSDFVFITNDNPREEEPKNIALDIEIGMKQANYIDYKIILDRELAIKEAISMANKNDIVLIAGKGHEDYQIIGNEKIHFSDKEEAIKNIKYIQNEKKEKELF